MENKKLIKNIAVYLISLSVPVLICLSIYQHLQIKKLSQDVNRETTVSYNAASNKGRTAQNNITEGITPADNLENPGKNDTGDIKDQLNATEKKLDTAGAQLSNELAKQAELKKIEEVNKAKSQGDNSKSNIAYFKYNLDSEYGPLFKGLNLSSNKLYALKQLLVDKYAESMEYREEIVNGVRLTVTNENEVKAEEYNTKINELLGESDYQKYKLYEETRGDRSWVNSFISLSNPTEPLTEDQQQRLINSMYEKRKSIESELKNYEISPDSLSKLDDAAISRVIRKRDRINEEYISAAKDILSESQAKQFAAYLKENRDRYESSLKESLGNKQN
jgi:hypothetical protein